MAVEISATDDFWMRPMSPRRSLVIVWMAASRAPVSSSDVTPTLARRSPPATCLATSTAVRIGVEIVRATTSAASVTPRIVASDRPMIAARWKFTSAKASFASCFTFMPQRKLGR